MQFLLDFQMCLCLFKSVQTGYNVSILLSLYVQVLIFMPYTLVGKTFPKSGDQ